MADGKFNDIATGISTLLGAVTAIVASVAAWQADQAKDKATLAESAAKDAQASFEQIKYHDQQQFELFSKIEGLLKDNQSGSLVLATTYVSLVGDPKTRGVWCGAVLNYARIRDAQLTAAERNAVYYAKDCLADAADQRVKAEQVVAAAPVAATAPTTTAPVVTATAAPESWPDKQVVSAGKPLGYDIDVFACESAGVTSLARARKVAEQLAQLSDHTGKIGHADLGQVRLRTLTRLQEAKGGFPANRNQVQADPDEGEEAVAQLLAGLAQQASAQPFNVGRSHSSTDFYLSVFACGS